MGGVFGAFSADGARPTDAVLQSMAQSIRHRGPGHTGVSGDGSCALGECRLSGAHATQRDATPQTSDDGGITVVGDGAIYNAVELRETLQNAGRRFTAKSDAELLLRAYEHWGADFVTRLNGDFAIAIHDHNERALFLYRDHLGAKPLFLHEGPTGQLLFASEIKALLEAGVAPSPDMTAIAQYLALGYVPPPLTVFSGIRCLPPAHMARVDARDGLRIRRYWDLAQTRCETGMTEAEAQAGVLALLDDATRLRMRSDASFGALLSGEVDSGAVIGLMSLYKPENLRSFSIGSDDPAIDGFALRAAKRFGTVHQTRTAPTDAAGLWPRSIWRCEQPHAAAPFARLDHVAALAARDVGMVMTGDGCDAFFAGDEKLLALFPGGRVDHLTSGWEDAFARSSGPFVGDQLKTLLTGALREAFFDGDAHAPLTDEIRRGAHHDPINRIALGEALSALPGDALVRADRMAMGRALETRSPFLDHRIAEFALKAPGAMKLAGGETKAVFRRAVEPLLGREMTYRKARPAPALTDERSRSALTAFCRDTLLDGRFEARGVIDAATASGMIDAHEAGAQDNARPLKALTSLELWFRLFIDNDSETRRQAA